MQAGRQAVLSRAACLPNISAALGPCFQHSSAPRIGGFGNEEPQGHRALQKTRPLAREQGSRAGSAALSGPQWPYPDTSTVTGFPRQYTQGACAHGSPGTGMAPHGRVLSSPCWAGGRQGMAGQPAWDRAVPAASVLAKATGSGGGKGRVPWADQEPAAWDSCCALASQGTTLHAWGVGGSTLDAGSQGRAGVQVGTVCSLQGCVPRGMQTAGCRGMSRRVPKLARSHSPTQSTLVA